LINDSIAKGIDPITLPIGRTDGEVAVRSVKRGPGQMKSFSNFPRTLHISFLFNSSHCAYHFEEVFIDNGAEIARCFGSDATTSAIENVWQRQIRPGAKSITATLNQGGDPKDLALMDALWTAGKGTKGRPFEVSELFAQHVFLLSKNSQEASVGTLSLFMMSCRSCPVFWL